MILYDYPGGPNPRRVRIFLAEKGVEATPQPLDIALFSFRHGHSAHSLNYAAFGLARSRWMTSEASWI